MARQQYKTVHTSLRTSRKLASADDQVARLYFHVLLASDAYGTLSGDPWDVFHEAVSGVRGFDVDAVSDCLEELVGCGLLERWTELDGSVWLYVTKHDEILSQSQRGKRGGRSNPTPPSQVAVTRSNSELPPTSQYEANSEVVGVSRRVSRGEEKTSPTRAGAALGPHADHLRHVPDGSALAASLGHQRAKDLADDIDAELSGRSTRLRVTARDLPTAAHPPRHAQGGAPDSTALPTTTLVPQSAHDDEAAAMTHLEASA